MHTLRALMADQMRAHLVEQACVRAFADQEIIQWPQHRPKTIGIGHPPIVAAARAFIFDRLPRAGHRAFEQAAIIGARQCAEQCTIQRKRLRGIGTGQNRTRERALRAIMNTQQRKRIGVHPGQQGFDGGRRWLHSTFQISRAYSPMVRSDENQPTLAIFFSTVVCQPALSCQRRSIWRWAAL